MTVLVTGSAGFIGMHVVARLLADGETVVGFDNRDDYYDVGLKHARVDRNLGHPRYTEVEGDLVYPRALEKVMRAHRPRRVIHLAARPGAAESAARPHACAGANLTGFLHVLEACRTLAVEHLVFASASDVYGDNAGRALRETDAGDCPGSLHAASKRAGELMAASYASGFGLPVTALRLFSVYGPWGRPDMAYFEFTRRLLAGETIELHHQGRAARDLVHVDDAVEAIVRALALVPETGAGGRAGEAPLRILNVGSGRSTAVADLVEALAGVIGCRARVEAVDGPPGNVALMRADTACLAAALGFVPAHDLAAGLAGFVDWYRMFHGE